MNQQEFLSLQRSFFLLGDRQTLQILYALDTNGEMMFSQLRDELKINPRTLSDRLKRLQKARFIVADTSKDKLRVFYRIDDYPKEISRVLDAYERLATALNETA